MAKKLSLEEIEHHARNLLDSEMASVRQLVENKDRVEQLREQLADADREEQRAYHAALAAGWSTTELAGLGLKEPERQAGARRRRTATVEATTAAQ